MKYRVLGCLLIGCLTGSGCSKAEGKSPAQPPSGIQPKAVADMLHAVMKADRTIYTKEVVNRLIKQQKVEIMNPESKAAEPLAASEQWKTEHGKLPLPAQMFRMGAEMVASENVGFSYGLLSQWPINKQNKPKTAMETRGLEAVVSNSGKTPFYGEEMLGGVKYFTAVYGDMAVTHACIDCHNGHKDSPRTDFKLGDVMGGVVLRIPLGS
jgi:hypothetical protein